MRGDGKGVQVGLSVAIPNNQKPTSKSKPPNMTHHKAVRPELVEGSPRSGWRSVMYTKIKVNTAGGRPAASHFFLLRQRKSNQKEGDPGLPPFGFPRSAASKRGCATRPGGAHTPRPTAGLEQCSPKPPPACG